MNPMSSLASASVAATNSMMAALMDKMTELQNNQALMAKQLVAGQALTSSLTFPSTFNWKTTERNLQQTKAIQLVLSGKSCFSLFISMYQVVKCFMMLDLSVTSEDC